MENKAQVKVTYADADHPKIIEIARQKCTPDTSLREKFIALFRFVRDDIPFGFPPVWDYVTASETLDYGVGYCNTKSILLQALCQAAHIPVRLRAGLINTRVMKHIFPNWAFPFLPPGASHMWIKVALEDGWHEVDAHIIDQALFVASKDMLLKDKGLKFGYGLGPVDPDCEGDWDQGFVQTGALLEDYGKWNEAADFYASKNYQPLNWFHTLTMPMVRGVSNRTIVAFRNYGYSLLHKKQERSQYQHIA